MSISTKFYTGKILKRGKKNQQKISRGIYENVESDIFLWKWQLEEFANYLISMNVKYI